MSEPQSVFIAGADLPPGRAIARRFSEAGARLALFGSNEAALDDVGAGEESILKLRGDRTSLTEVETAVTRALETHGALDVLVNCAEPPRPAPIEDLDEEAWRHTMDGFLKAAFGLAKFASQTMVSRRGGRIVNLGSSEVLGRPGYTHGAAAAAGLVSLTRTLALELARFSITVNAVVPGVIVWDESEEADAGARAATVPARRPGTPGELADAVHFLASEKAAYITGQVLYVDGGRDLLPALVLEPPDA